VAEHAPQGVELDEIERTVRLVVRSALDAGFEFRFPRGLEDARLNLPGVEVRVGAHDLRP
jgi:hypothetical protein